LELFGQQLLGQCVIRLLEISTDSKDSAIDARLSLAVKIRAVIEPLENEPLLDPIHHRASLLAVGIEAELHQGHETVERNNQVPVLFRQIVSPPARASAPLAGRRLAGE
jgi:hypothetical protein